MPINPAVQSASPTPGSKSLLNLSSVTRVRNSGSVYAGPLANDLENIQTEINQLHRIIQADKAEDSGGDTPAALPISDFLLAPADFRDDGAMDIAVQAISLAGGPPAVPQPPQIVFCVQSTFPTLSLLPANTLVAVTDYAHLIYWDGTSSTFMDGGNCFIALFDIDPGAGWHLLDGTIDVPYLKADGTLGTYTVEDATVPFYLKADLVNSGPNAAAAPTISGHTEAAATGITVSAAAPATVTTGTALAGATQAVVTALTSGGGGGGSVTDPQHQHNLSSANAPISTTGQPRNLARRPYFRQ